MIRDAKQAQSNGKGTKHQLLGKISQLGFYFATDGGNIFRSAKIWTVLLPEVGHAKLKRYFKCLSTVAVAVNDTRMVLFVLCSIVSMNIYPLVNQHSYLACPIEIVDLSNLNMVDRSTVMWLFTRGYPLSSIMIVHQQLSLIIHEH